MLSTDTFLVTLVLVSAFFVVSMNAQHWDVAVAVRNRIDFLTRDGIRIFNLTFDNDAKMEGLAYDNDTQTLYMSDTKDSCSFIYSYKLADKSSKPSLLLKIEHSEVLAIAVDPHEKMLYWTDKLLKALTKMEIPSEENRKPAPMHLHNYTDIKPHGIALDIWNGYIYWTNTYGVIRSIERSKLDGSSRTVIVGSGELHRAYGLAIDHKGGKLYWTDDSPGDSNKIKRSDLDGNNTEIFWVDDNQQPVYIAVNEDSVYWTDWVTNAVWKKGKNHVTHEPAVKIMIYDKFDGVGLIHSIITRENTGIIDNDEPRDNKIGKNAEWLTSTVEFHNNVMNNTAKITTTTTETIQIDKNCRKNSYYDESTSTCRCREGFIGDNCVPSSPCYNYCIHGSCTLSNEGLPKCRCPSSYDGDRCERDICYGYCLNGGSCSVKNSKPLCSCAENFRGPRCEHTTELDEICSRYCMGSENTLTSVNITLCRSGEWNKTSSEFPCSTEQPMPSAIIIWTLVAVIGTLTIVVGVLSYHVQKLRRRPRIKKRFFGGKRGNTQLTSRPQGPTDSYEISIENCCNMNICETPCFEPKLRTTPTKSKTTKKDEKNSLLDSMEGADSC